MRQGREFWSWPSIQIDIFLLWWMSALNTYWCRCIQSKIRRSRKVTWCVIKPDWCLPVLWVHNTYSWTYNRLWWCWSDVEPCQWTKNIIALVSSIVSSTSVCAPNLRHFRKVCNTNNIPTWINMQGGGVVILKKEGKIKTEKVTQAEQ